MKRVSKNKIWASRIQEIGSTIRPSVASMKKNLPSTLSDRGTFMRRSHRLYNLYPAFVLLMRNESKIYLLYRSEG
ncbi:hypothetical protein CEXT_146951, partial [Caerostris extrusa]